MNQIEVEFQRLSNEFLIMASKAGSMAEMIEYLNLSGQVDSIHEKLRQVLLKTGKEKTASGAANTESGMQKDSINQCITIIVSGKEQPPELQQFTDNFLSMAKAVRERRGEYI